jgi:hypothetical protein
MTADFPEINLATVERDLATNVRYRSIYFKLGPTAQMLLALDDHCLVREAYPTLDRIGPCDQTGAQTFKVTAPDAYTMASDLHERSLPGDGGFGHTASERRAARIAHDTIRRALQRSL